MRHSWIDDRDTFARFDGAISVVVPYFARRGINLRRCGVHRHVGGAFNLVNNKQLDKRIVVIPGHADLRRQERKNSPGISLRFSVVIINFDKDLKINAGDTITLRCSQR